MRKTILSMLLFLFITTLYSQDEKLSQNDRAVSFSATGIIFDRPMYIEFEAMFNSKMSIAFRWNYLNYSHDKMGEYLSSSSTPIAYTTSQSMKGFGLGLHPKWYIFGDGQIKGLYIGLGADLFVGKFDSQSTEDTGSGIARSYFNKNFYLTASIPLGYKFRVNRFIIDLSASFEIDDLRSDQIWQKNKLENTSKVFQYVVPGVSIGIVF